MVIPQAVRTRSITSGLSGSRELADAGLPVGKVLLHEKAPDRWRRAERGHAGADDRVEERLRLETRLVDPEDRRGGIPRREERAPGVLRPARRGDVEVDVARL